MVSTFQDHAAKARVSKGRTRGSTALRAYPLGDSNPCSLQWPLGSDSQLCYAPWRGRSTRRGFASAEPEVAFEVVVVVVVVAVSVGGDEVVSVTGRKLDGADFRRRCGLG